MVPFSSSGAILQAQLPALVNTADRLAAALARQMVAMDGMGVSFYVLRSTST